MNVKIVFAVLVSCATLGLAGCGGGGGDPQDATLVGTPHAVVKATKPTGGAAIALHLYQAFYGKAPSYALMTDYTAQATSAATTLASSLAGAFASTSHADLAKLVLDNLGVTATTVNAVNSKGESEYAILLDAVQQIFAAFPTMRGQVILNMTNLLEGLEADVTYGGAAVAYNSQAAANQTYATNPVNTSPAVVSATSDSGGTLPDGNGGTSSQQMGGAIQGTPLNLSTAVTTLAGYVSAIPVPVTNGTGTAASFYFPYGVTTDGTNLYVVDSVGNVRKLVIATGVVTTLAGPTLGANGSTDGTGTAARFALPRGITTDGTNLYVADTGNSTIRKVVISTGTVTTLAGTAGATGITDGTGAVARFYLPSSITTDGTNLYVADTGNHTIRKIVIATGVVTTLAGTASPYFGYGSTNGTGTAAKFSGPAGITTDGTNLFVADTGNNAIRKIVIAAGTVTTLAGGAFGSTDGTGTAALFYSPSGITTDGTNLYVADTLNTTIRKVVIATGAVTTLASTGWGTTGWGSAGVDGTGAAARFARPQGITSDGTNLYVSDIVSTTIRKIQ
jgi:sugar lactone lactonase YvrE